MKVGNGPFARLPHKDTGAYQLRPRTTELGRISEASSDNKFENTIF